MTDFEFIEKIYGKQDVTVSDVEMATIQKEFANAYKKWKQEKVKDLPKFVKQQAKLEYYNYEEEDVRKMAFLRDRTP